MSDFNDRMLHDYQVSILKHGQKGFDAGGYYEIPPAPQWVYHLIDCGITVAVGAWGKKYYDRGEL